MCEDYLTGWKPGPHQNMDLRITNNGSFTVAHLVGELSASDAEQLTESLSDSAFGLEARLAIDLSQLESLDSQGLSALIHLVTRSRMNRGRIILVAPAAFVKSIFSVTRLDAWFDICDTLDEARRQFAQY